MEDIRSRLHELRRKLGISQGKFAEKMGVKQNTWSNIENGTNPCSERYINLVCLTFNVRKEWLVNGQGEMLADSFSTPQTDSNQPSMAELSPEVAELIAIYNELVPLNQKAVLDFLEKTLQSQRNTIKDFESKKQY